MMPPNVFLDFTLPNAATWFYFSTILAVALFFDFRRVFTLRNVDLLALFVMVPGLLLVQEGHDRRREARQLGDTAARLHAFPDPDGAATLAAAVLEGPARQRALVAQGNLWWGYLGLLSGTLYWIIRCLGDLFLIERPTFQANLNLAGMAWLAVAVFLSLGAVAIRRPPPDEGQIGPPSALLQEAQSRTEQIVRQTSGETDRAKVRWWVERTLAGACHLFVILALTLVGRWHLGNTAAGIAAATAYLVLPYIAFHMTQVHHVLPTALLLWAVVAYRRPRAAGVFLGIAAGGFGFPALVAPVWASFYRGRGLSRFLTSFGIAAGVSLVLAALVLWLNGLFDLKIPTTIGVPDWRTWRVPDAEGFWIGVHWAYRIPVFIAAIAFVLVTALWPFPKDLAHVIALSAAHLLTAQLWYSDRGGVYVLWYLPLLLLMVFRPGLTDCMPPEDHVEGQADDENEPAARAWALVRYFRPPAVPAGS